MSLAGKRSFYSLFDSVDRIAIPIIQRDYAQGRKSARDVRLQFLDAIRSALLADKGSAEANLDLDFVYGTFESSDNDTFALLDGQQRLTTLFLLYWYLSAINGELDEFRARCVDNGHSRFTYATRPSSSEFLDELVTHDFDIPIDENGENVISKQIYDTSWFALSWKSDPTVISCLNMLDDIHELFGKEQGLYSRLVNESQERITFQFLDLEDFGLSDELYIKMNARGKPLSTFENFKAWLVGKIEGKPWAHEFDLKMDQKWLDLFWNISRKKGKYFDDLFLWFFYILAFFDGAEKLAGTYSRSQIDEETRDWLITTRTEAGYISLNRFELHESFSDMTLRRASTILDYLSDFATSSNVAILYEALASSDYLDLARFYALILFIEKYSNEENLPESHDALLSKWSRVTDNLFNNMRLDEMATFVPVIQGLSGLSEHALHLYKDLSDMKSWEFGFSRAQGEEEIKKAKLIQSGSGWEKVLLEAEDHEYLKGKVGFLLELSESTEGDSDQKLFIEYSKITHTLLSREILTSQEFLLQRALLSLGNYLIPKSGSKYSFCSSINSTYRDRSENWLQVVNTDLFSLLLKEVDANNVEGSLNEIINKVSCGGWRQLLVELPQLIRYCQNRFVHIEPALYEFYLLRKTRLSGYHADLYSYALYVKLERILKQSGKPEFIDAVYYDEEYGDRWTGIRIALGGDTFFVYHHNGVFKCIKDGNATQIPDQISQYLRRSFPEWSFQ